MSALLERNSVGKRQDLAPAFTLVDQKSTPFMSAVHKGEKPQNTLLEYPVEKYATPALGGVIDEAAPETYDDPNDGDAMLYSRVQIFEKAGRIGSLAQTTMAQAGRTPRQAVARAIAKKLVELKRNMELTFLSDQEIQIETGAVENLTRGLGKWILSGAQAVYPVDSNYRTPSASIDSSTASADYKDSTITAVAASMFAQCGVADETYTIWCGPSWKTILGHNLTFYTRNESNMTTVRNFDQGSPDKVTLGKVDMLDTDFGSFHVRVAQFINASGDPTSTASKLLAYVCPMDLVEVRTSDNPHSEILAKTSRSTEFLVTATSALCVKNPLGFGKFAPSS